MANASSGGSRRGVSGMGSATRTCCLSSRSRPSRSTRRRRRCRARRGSASGTRGSRSKSSSASGLRGRGGAGFPAGVKWGSVRAAGGGTPLRGRQRRRGRAGDVQGPDADAPRSVPGDRGSRRSPRSPSAPTRRTARPSASTRGEVAALRRAALEMGAIGMLGDLEGLDRRRTRTSTSSARRRRSSR